MSTIQDRIIAVQQAVEFDATGKPLKADGLFGPVSGAALSAMIEAEKLGTPWPVASPAAPVPAPGVGALVYGADTVDLISVSSIAEMTELIGRTPAFVARYVGSIYEYKHAQENGPAAAAGIKLLMIGDQTKRVCGSRAEGSSDGLANAKDVLASFPGLSGEIYLALDCENDPPLSADYWAGWCDGITDACKGTGVTFLAILYASEGAGETWAALEKAMASGAPCFGVWVADYITTTANNLPIAPAWNPLKARMLMPDGSTPSAPPVLIWQTAGGFKGTKFEPHDANMLNPSTAAAAFLSRCVTPPGAIA